MEDLKKQRSKEKSAVTRLGSKVKRYVDERSQEDVLRCIEELKVKYRDFEKVHESIHVQLEEVEDIEASDVYLIEAETKYCSSLSEGNVWLDSLVKKEEKEQPIKDKQENVLSQEIIAMLNLPKVELDCFDGDPLKYHSFMAVFDDTVDKVVSEASTKLTRLLQYTTGKAKDAIQPCAILGGTKGYELAKRILYERYGNDLLISEMLISTLKTGKPVRTASELQVLSNELTNCNIILTRMYRIEELNSQHFIASIVDRMQMFQKNKWRKVAMNMKQKEQRYPTFENLVDFVHQEAVMATDPIYGEGGLLKFSRDQASTGSQQTRSNNQQQTRSQNTSFVSNQGRTVTPCPFCNQEHRLYMCDAFKALKPEQKLNVIVDKKLCENCLLDNHVVETCMRPSMCGINDCKEKHSRFIHQCKIQVQNTSEVSAFTNVGTKICIPVVKVKVNNVSDSSALLDTCSTSTFCSQRLADKLGLKGVSVKYELSTLNNKGLSKETGLIPSLYVESTSSGEMLSLKNVYIIDDIPMTDAKIDVNEFSHLCDLPVQQTVGEVDLLIGQDNSEALLPLEVRKGEVGEPFAVRTLLGWSLHGPTKNDVDCCGLISGNEKPSRKVVNHFIMSNNEEIKQFSKQARSKKLGVKWKVSSDFSM